MLELNSYEALFCRNIDLKRKTRPVDFDKPSCWLCAKQVKVEEEEKSKCCKLLSFKQ